MANSKLTTEEITKIAYLARLKLTDQELEMAAGHLSDILAHFSQIQNIDTANVPTADDASGLKNITRTDEPKPEDLAKPADVLATAPKTKDGQIQVPAIFS